VRAPQQHTAHARGTAVHCSPSRLPGLITATDHASIQVNVGHLDSEGVYTGAFTTFALSGFVRAMVRASGRP